MTRTAKQSEPPQSHPWWRLHWVTWLALLPVFFFWAAMTVPGISHGIYATDRLLENVSRLTPEEIKLLPKVQPPPSGGQLTQWNQPSLWNDLKIKSHGWPYHAFDKVVIHADDIDKSKKPEFPSNITSVKANWSGNEGPPWMDISAWVMKGDWFYFRWQGLLANLSLALGSLLVVGLIVELWFRIVGPRLRLWQFLAAAMLISYCFLYIGNRINNKKANRQLMQTKPNYSFFNQFNLSYSHIVQPDPKRRERRRKIRDFKIRLLGSQITQQLEPDVVCSVSWDSGMPDDFWKPMIGTEEVACIRVGHGEPWGDSRPLIPLHQDFFAAIANQRSVKALSLEYCEIGVDDLASLEHSKLVYIGIKHAELGDASLETFAKMKRLKTLSLTGTGVTPEKVKQLRKLRPDLEITY